MATHLLCYIRRDKLTEWKLQSLERGTASAPVLIYGSDHPMFGRFAKRGNVVWIVGADPNGLISLEAKIEIASELRKNKGWKYAVAGDPRTSVYYGFNDASNAVMRLIFTNKANSLWSLQSKHSSTEWKRIYGRALEGTRWIAPTGIRMSGRVSDGAALLERHASRSRRRSIFISWKHNDNTGDRYRFLRALTVELTRQGLSVWWDQTALTDVDIIAKSPRLQRDPMMKRLLGQALSQTRIVLAPWTPCYGTSSKAGAPNWTRNEWQQRGVTRIAMAAGTFATKPGLRKPDRFVRVSDNPTQKEAVVVARRIKRTVDSIVSVHTNRTR